MMRRWYLDFPADCTELAWASRLCEFNEPLHSLTPIPSFWLVTPCSHHSFPFFSSLAAVWSQFYSFPISARPLKAPDAELTISSSLDTISLPQLRIVAEQLNKSFFTNPHSFRPSYLPPAFKQDLSNLYFVLHPYLPRSQLSLPFTARSVISSD